MWFRCSMIVLRRQWIGLLLALLSLVAVSAGRAEELLQDEQEEPSDIRAQFQIRWGDSSPFSAAHDLGGVSAGIVYGRYLGFDLGLDSYEIFVNDSTAKGVDKLAELSVLSFGPALRLRYPLFGGRLEPYVLAGGGIAIEELNDRRGDARLPGNAGKRLRPFGVFGGGIDYFFAENAAVGLEGRYFVLGSETVRDGDLTKRVDLDAGTATVNLRVLVPQGEGAPSVADSRAASRFSFAIRVGGALPIRTEAFPGVRVSAEQSILGSKFTTQFGASAGFDWTDWLSVDLSLDNYEYSLSSGEDGAVGEYSLFPILVQSRIRFPGLPERWEPYGLAGVGAEIAEVNDGSLDAKVRVGGGDVAVIGAFGIGLDYYFASNASVGLLARYFLSRGHEIEVGDERLRGNLDTFVLSLGLRVFFGEIS